VGSPKMAELSTAYQLPVKIVVLKNNSLGEVSYEQMEIGNPEFGCTLSPIDFVAFAKPCGADGFRCERPDEVRPAIEGTRPGGPSERLLGGGLRVAVEEVDLRS
jgi:thiamine pyrophosphate-dependent acetolactate synthase large subunit-like protein